MCVKRNKKWGTTLMAPIILKMAKKRFHAAGKYPSLTGPSPAFFLPVTYFLPSIKKDKYKMTAIMGSH